MDIVKAHNIKSILILRQDRIGDLIISETFVRKLREKYPQLKIDILLGKRNASAMFIVQDYVNSVLVYQQKPAKDIANLLKHRNKYDLVIDLLDKPSRTSHIICKVLNPKFTAGFDYELNKDYDFKVKPLSRLKHHIVERTSKLLELFDYDLSTLDYKYKIKAMPCISELVNISKSGGNKLFMINLSGSHESRNWGEQNYSNFIKLVKSERNDYTFILLYTADLIHQALQIEQDTGAIAHPLIPSFEEYVSVLSSADFILTPDTSAVHIVSAFDIPQVCLFARDIHNITADEIPWYPYKSQYFAFGEEDGNMKCIAPKAVFDAIKHIL